MMKMAPLAPALASDFGIPPLALSLFAISAFYFLFCIGAFSFQVSAFD
jgi:hypothetical protein